MKTCEMTDENDHSLSRMKACENNENINKKKCCLRRIKSCINANENQ